jgi:hypothetical protein
MRIGVAVALGAAGWVLIGFGVWIIVKAKLPAWMKGIWKSPLGDYVTPTVARLMGWSSLFVGIGCLPTVVVLALWDRSASTWLASEAAMFLVGLGSFPWVWGVWLSRTGDKGTALPSGLAETRTH